MRATLGIKLCQERLFLVARKRIGNLLVRRDGSVPTFSISARSLSDSDDTWPMGVGLILLLAGTITLRGFWRPVSESLFEWIMYLVLGLVFPALVILLCGRVGHPAGRRALQMQWAILCAGVVILISLVLLNGPISAPLLAIVEVILVRWFNKRARSTHNARNYLLLLLVSTAAWAASLRYFWWQPIHSAMMQQPLDAAVFLPALAFTSFAVVYPGPALPAGIGESRTFVKYVGIPIALVLLAFFSFSSDRLFDGVTFSHWSVLVGPAKLEQQGGWPLWDVPAQYGFLSTLMIAVLPIQSAWDALYLITGATVFISAALIFFVLWIPRPDSFNLVFALLAAIAAIFWVPRSGFSVNGAMSLPSTGAFRFIWCYILLGILIWAYKVTHFGHPGRAVRWVGSGAWLLGMLWSCESGLYCSLIWLPAYVLLSLRWQGGQQPSIARIATDVFRSLLLPGILLVVTIVGIDALYLFRLGHPPDWIAYADYALSFGSGFGHWPLDMNGAVWSLLLPGFAVIVITVRAVQGYVGGNALPLLAGTWATWWSTASYFVGRSHPSNVTNLFPLAIVTIAVALYLDRKSRLETSSHSLLRIMSIPVLTVAITIDLSHVANFRSEFKPNSAMYASNLTNRLPPINRALRRLLLTAHITSRDRIFLFDDSTTAQDRLYSAPETALPAWTWPAGTGYRTYQPDAWLPAYPLDLVVPLRHDRVCTYIARFAAHTHFSGWLIDRTERPYTSVPWFARILHTLYEPQKQLQSAHWRLIKFRYRPRQTTQGGQGCARVA